MEKAGTGIKRVRDGRKAIGNKCSYHFTDASWLEMVSNERSTAEGVNVGVNKLFDIIKNSPGINSKEIHRQFDVTIRTIERWIKELREKEKIEFSGAPKTGGYYAVKK